MSAPPRPSFPRTEMSGSEAMAIEWGFGLSVGMMALGVAAGLAKMRRERAEAPEGVELGEAAPELPPPLPAVRMPDRPVLQWNSVHPPALTPVDLVGVLMIATIYFGFFIMSLNAPPPSEGAALSVADVVASVVTQGMIAGSILIMVAPRCNPVRFFGLRWRQWPWVFLVALAATFFVLTVFAGLEALGYSQWMREHLQADPLQRTVMVLRESKDPVLLGLMGFTAIVVAPLCEEMVFRGYVYPVVKRYGGMWVAAVGSALLFSSAHSHAVGLLPLFLLGLVLVAVYELTGSLWASIAVHACFNATTVGTTLLFRFHDIPIPSP